MSEMNYEECIYCHELTGKAGKGDGSLYIGTIGPFCDDCYDETGIAQLEAEAVCHHCEQTIPKPEWDDHWKACENSPYKSLIAERQEMLEYMNEEVGTEHLPEEWQIEGE